ncbi:AAA family ATPase [Paenibacillus barcinonensis]|uniref:AAA family ATPase n=1 Tax=Paenibacillus barcinonensis TaxID=198119 RepID=A0A2V4VP46_PAEBA|nr:AAA family ATPase [Paenibacillus barcinonensis]PYE51621.1 ATP-dependent DNA helicase (RecD/TraA family) [Paenibacillus barcinonensis]QKS55985.1 AAA family ATPase [Paenibacillus barcinonensis]
MSIIELKLTPEKMMFPRKEADNKNDFRIYSCNTNSPNVLLNSYGNLSVKGVMQRLELGVEYEAQIELEKVDAKYGASYNVLSIYQDVPETMEGQKAFLATLMTDLQLKEVYKTYPNEDIVKLIVDNKFEYEKVKQFGSKTYNKIRDRILENIAYRDVLSRLGKYGITYDIILKLEKTFGSKELAIQKIEDNPYELTQLSGFGFKRADKIAQLMGFKKDDPHRIKYGIRFTIDDNQQQGHTYMLKDELLRNASEKLELAEVMIENFLYDTDGLVFVDDKVSLTRTYNAEKYIAKRLAEMLENGISLNFDPDKYILEIEATYKEDIPKGLTYQQKDFFRSIQKYSVNLLIGYAGTGKSKLQKFLVDLLNKLGLTYVLLSPSAKAAKVTRTYTGVNAQTIHRRIGFGMDKEEEMMLEIHEDFVIIDESGMTDVFILSSLLSKIKNPNTRILFVGDDFQLLSVQAGNFLHDAIVSGAIPMTKLDIVFRQGDGGILDVATKIREGKQIVNNDFEGKQLFGNDFLLHCVDQVQIEKGYKHYYNLLLNTYKPEDIMVLSPTKKGKLGTVELNKHIQEQVNPFDSTKKQHEYGYDGLIRVGDYILNTVNMYQIANMSEEGTDIVNGDSGKVIDIKLEDDKKNSDDELAESERKGIIIQFDDQLVRLDIGLAAQLLSAWALTIHKSQGSSSEATLIVVDRSNKFQISANLIYTAITRSVSKCIFLTQAETLNFAIRKVESKRRNTHLCNLLREIN